MNSEEVRLDLESFINKGLKKELRGWPLKGRKVSAAGNRSQPPRALTLLGLACCLEGGSATRYLEVLRGA